MDPKPPQDRKFYHIFGHIMAIGGLGSNLWWWYKYPKMLKYYFQFQRWCMPYVGIVCFSSQLVFLYVYSSRLDKSTLSIVFSIIPIGFVGTLKVICSHTESYEKMVVDFMEKIHLYNYYCTNKSEFVKTILKKVEKTTVYIVVSSSTLMLAAWFMWMLTPVLYNVRNIESILNGSDNFRTCYYMWMPFDYLHNIKYYYIENILNIYITFVAILVILTYDMINYIIIFNLLGHIQVLKHNIQTRFEGEMNDDIAKSKLIEIIHQHRFIYNTFQDVKNTFGLSIAANYLQNLLEDSLLMHQFMLGDKENVVTYGLTLVYYLGSLVIMSLVLEEIRRETEDLSDILYTYVPWHNMNLSNQKTFRIILSRMQPVFDFVALGCFRAGIMPAISIIKATFSYYVVIKSRM